MKSLLSILIISICAGVYFMYIKPLSAEIRVLTAKKEEYDNVLNRVKEIKEKRDAVLADYDSISPTDIDKLNKIIPEEINSVALVNDLNNIGLKYGITVKDFKLIDSGATDRAGVVSGTGQIYKTTSVNMSVSGEYQAFLNFLDEVESALSLFDIVSLSIKQTAVVGAGQTGMDYQLGANIYSLR